MSDLHFFLVMFLALLAFVILERVQESGPDAPPRLRLARLSAAPIPSSLALVVGGYGLAVGAHYLGVQEVARAGGARPLQVWTCTGLIYLGFLSLGAGLLRRWNARGPSADGGAR